MYNHHQNTSGYPSRHLIQVKSKLMSWEKKNQEMRLRSSMFHALATDPKQLTINLLELQKQENPMTT